MARKTKVIPEQEVELEGEEVLNEDEVDTEAGKTIQAHPSAASRAGMMSQVTNGMANMNYDDMTHWFQAAMSLIGHEADKIPDGIAAKNKSTIDAKPSGANGGALLNAGFPPMQVVREDLKELLDENNIPKEMEEKTLLLFESAVSARVALERAALEEAYEQKLAEEADSITQDLDTYLDYAAGQFFEENQIAIENALRVDLYEEFVDGLRDLFEKHYVQLPEDKVDVVGGLADRVEELEKELNDRERELLDAREAYDGERARAVFDEIAENLTDTQVEKFKSLVENVEYDGDEEALSEKLEIIRDAHFNGKTEVDGKKTAPRVAGSFPGLLTEEKTVTVTVDKDEEATQEVPADPEVAAYVDAISRTVKRKF
jgi:hypothetical protein